MLGTRPVSHTGGHQLGPFHDCTFHRQHCHSERSQLYPEEVVDCHASGTLLKIELHLNIINCPVTFNLDPPKIILFPLKQIFWTHSEKFVPTVDQPQEGKSVHVNSHEGSTKDISGVHGGISRKLNDWFPPVCLSWPYTVFAHNVCGNECSM